jgi:23S rRNA pseudouridine2605 synthase
MMADPEGRPTLVDYLAKVKSRLFPIGRLDFTSEGLLLLTNDGQFAEQLSRRDDIPRVYHIKIKGHPNAEMLSRIEKGGRLGNRFVKPHSVRLVEEFTQKARIEIVILDSGAIDIRALLESRGFLVDRIVRTAIGHLTLGQMAPGAYRLLTKSQMEALLKQPELGMRRLANDASDGVMQPSEREQRQEQSEADTAASGWRAPTRDEMRRERPAIAVKFRGDRRDTRGPSGAAGGIKPKYSDRGGDRSERREGGFDRPKRGFGADRAATSERPKRSFGGEKREGGFDRPKRGIGADRAGTSERPKRSFGGEKLTGGFGAKREGGYVPKRSGTVGSKRDSGFGAPRGEKRGFGAGPSAGPRPSRSSSGPKREGGFGAKRTGGKPAPRGKRR